MLHITVALSAESVGTLSIPTPGYDRSKVTAGIVHFGVGGFHRSHEAMYLDRLMNQGKALDWGICGVGVLPGDRHMQQVMAEQDCLYTLVLKHPDGRWEPRIIGSIVQYLYAPDDPGAVIEKLADPRIRTVSLTVTEGGYNIDHVTGEFNAAAPAIAADPITVASWARYSEAVDESGQRIEVIEPLHDQLHPLAQRQAVEPTAFLSYRELFDDLIDNHRFVDLYTAALDSLHRRGAMATVADVNRATWPLSPVQLECR